MDQLHTVLPKPWTMVFLDEVLVANNGELTQDKFERGTCSLILGNQFRECAVETNYFNERKQTNFSTHAVLGFLNRYKFY